MALQHVALRLMQPSDHDQFVTDFHSQQRLGKSWFDLEPRIRRAFLSLPRRVFTAFHSRSDEANRLERVRVHPCNVLHLLCGASSRPTPPISFAMQSKSLLEEKDESGKQLSLIYI